MFRRVYRSNSPVTRHERRVIYAHMKCQRSQRDKRIVKLRHAGWKHTHAKRRAEIAAKRAMLALTPYPGPNGTRWAIPFYIVRCESTARDAPQGGSWTVINSIGARGPYQFNGWPVPWPVRTQAHKLAHHRMAAYLWKGGAGRSNWAECL